MKERENVKKVWIWISVIGAALVVSASMTAKLPEDLAHADVTSASPSATITVIGHSEQQVKPDIALINAGVTSVGKDAKSAQETNDSTMNKVMDALKSAKIPSSDIHLMWYSIQPNYGPPGKDGRPQMIGFQASSSFEVTIQNLSNVGDIIDTLVQSGANQINNVEYQISDPLTIEEKAYDSALMDAKSQAANIAQNLGVSISGVQSVDTTNQNNPEPIFNKTSTSGANSSLPSPGTQTISTNVKVVYIMSSSNK